MGSPMGPAFREWEKYQEEMTQKLEQSGWLDTREGREAKVMWSRKKHKDGDRKRNETPPDGPTVRRQR